MSRVIKFRAFDKVSKSMSEPFSLFGEFTLLGAVFAWLDHVRGLPDGACGLHQINDIEILQFTGLHDVNGVEIYESDVVSMWYAPQAKCKGVISFTDGCFVFETNEAKPLSCPAHDCVNKNGNYFTVIGNIHQNPELLDPKL